MVVGLTGLGPLLPRFLGFVQFLDLFQRPFQFGVDFGGRSGLGNDFLYAHRHGARSEAKIYRKDKKKNERRRERKNVSKDDVQQEKKVKKNLKIRGGQHRMGRQGQ